VITRNWCRKRVPLWIRRVGRDLLLCIIRLWNVGGAIETVINLSKFD